MFDCKGTFVDTNANENVFVFNKIIFGILPIFVPHETLTIDDKDLSWFAKI